MTHHEPIDIPIIACAPFVIILLLIAIMPLAFPHFWEKNRNKAIVSAIVSLPILVYLSISLRAELLHTIVDYIAFIILLASLYIVSGGILMTGDLRATPANNTILFFVGSIIANFIGTTGASMLLIRPVLKTNSERKHIKHIPVFFIFTVSNIGGCLTPLGDPPLFLGYLKGVPFTWTLRLLPEWIFALAVVLTIFYIWDTFAYRRETVRTIKYDKAHVQPIRFKGLINILFLLGVIASVGFQFPAPYRELTMIGMTALSLIFTKKKIRKEHKFTYHPITEVAVLFAGIFITMVPILTLLRMKGAQFGITEPYQFFWYTGILSSFLDNAPTYLTFFSLAQSVTDAAGNVGMPIIAGVKSDLLAAISVGAVFMGANTYIGNGPNFMVKSIAEEQRAKVPHFFGYMAYSGLVLIPTFILATVVFFR
jgi:Na+/H+ antiporter NhaD/arsenite permease-like protein